MTHDRTTDYLPAAITTMLADENNLSAAEVMADLSDYFSGSASADDVARELSALVAGDVIECYEVDGITYYMDPDAD